jgi:hypothetical protein
MKRRMKRKSFVEADLDTFFIKPPFMPPYYQRTVLYGIILWNPGSMQAGLEKKRVAFSEGPISLKPQAVAFPD